MKSHITKSSIYVGLVAFLFLGAPAYAQNTSTTDVRPTKEALEARRDAIQTQREERLQEVKENRDAIKEERREQVDAIKAGVEERKEERKMNRQERALDFIERVQERFTNIANHMESIIVNIEERLGRLNGRMTTDTAYTELDLAKESLQDARAGIASLTDLTQTLGNSSSTPDTIATVRNNIQSVHELLKEAHSHIVAAVRSVKSVSSEKNIAENPDNNENMDEDNQTSNTNS